MKKSYLKVWTFNGIENKFDKHILNSIPGYKEVWWNCIEMIQNFISKKTIIYDIGCSTGKKTLEIYKRYKNLKNLQVFGIDHEKSMINYANNNFKISSNIHFVKKNILNYNFKKTNIFVCLYTLNFLDYDERKKLLMVFKKNLKTGGAIFVADKVLNKDSSTENMLNQVYAIWKSNFFTEEEIFEKNVSIRGILKPLNEEKLNKLFTSCGFQSRLISKNLNFNFYILTKN